MHPSADSNKFTSIWLEPIKITDRTRFFSWN